jgi:hypothetical protein
MKMLRTNYGLIQASLFCFKDTENAGTIHVIFIDDDSTEIWTPTAVQ